jgi:hypothetical protein
MSLASVNSLPRGNSQGIQAEFPVAFAAVFAKFFFQLKWL